MTEHDAYTPQRIRNFASLVYRLAAGNPLVREVGDFLTRCATAADEQGDLLQQRDHLRAELARLHQATAEAEAHRLRAEQLAGQLDDALKVAAAARIVARQERSAREKLESEARGNRLWFELARALVDEAKELLPADKAALIDPLRAARVASSDRGRLAKAEALLRSALDYLTLAATNDADGRAGRLAAAISAHLEADK